MLMFGSYVKLPKGNMLANSSKISRTNLGWTYPTITGWCPLTRVDFGGYKAHTLGVTNHIHAIYYISHLFPIYIYIILHYIYTYVYIYIYIYIHIYIYIYPIETNQPNSRVPPFSPSHSRPWWRMARGPPSGLSKQSPHGRSLSPAINTHT